MEPKLRSQKEWGWCVAADLFFAGVGAGAYAVGAVSDLAGERGAIARTGVALGFPCVMIGTFFLLADLGVKARALRAFMNPGTSWISRGTIIISTFMVLAAVQFATWIWPLRLLEDAPAARRILEAVNLLFAALTMVYTGVLLGASRPISLWSTAMLPVLFLLSALGTGAMAILLATSLIGAPAGLAQTILLLVVGQGLALALYLQATHRTPESRASAALLLSGRLAPHFWIGVVALGLAAPLAAGLLDLGWPAAGSGGLARVVAVVASLCGLAGGLLLRYVVLAAGVRAPLRAGGISYNFPVPVASVGPARPSGSAGPHF